MAIVRIYLCTYRRNALLPRAIESLQAQTLTDWVCELHNDDPSDPFPQTYVEQLKDPRITVITHDQNWGAMRVFNQVFQAVEEAFVSLLEDDNWWEPPFLETMVATLDRHPEVQVAWANLRLCEETDDGWQPTGETVWPLGEPAASQASQPGQASQPIELFHFPDRRQVFGALHSQGAMVVRAPHCGTYQVPDSTTSAAGEHVRERVFDYPIALVPQVLGNYALTRDTSRSSHRATWNSIQILLGGSFLAQVPLRPETLAEIWADARSRRVSSVPILFWIALAYPGCRWLLGQAQLSDWIQALGHSLWRWQQTLETYQILQQQQPLKQFLHHQTSQRLHQAQTTGFQAL